MWMWVLQLICRLSPRAAVSAAVCRSEQRWCKPADSKFVFSNLTFMQISWLKVIFKLIKYVGAEFPSIWSRSPQLVVAGENKTWSNDSNHKHDNIQTHPLYNPGRLELCYCGLDWRKLCVVFERKLGRLTQVCRRFSPETKTINSQRQG